MREYVTAFFLFISLIPILPGYKVSANFTTVLVSPLDSYATVGNTFDVNVSIADVANLTSWKFTMYFLNGVVNCTNVAEGPFLKTFGGTSFSKAISNNYNSTHGSVQAYSTLVGNATADGSGVLATVTFNALSVADITLQLDNTDLNDEKIPPQPIDHVDVDGSVHIQNFTLTVSTIGSGSVNSTATGPYHYGEVLILAAVPAIGWWFKDWSNDLAGSTSPASLVITGNMSVAATFTQNVYIVDPPSFNVTVGANFGVNINITSMVNVTRWEFKLYFPNSILNCTSVAEGPFLKSGGGTFFGQNITNNYNGTYGRVRANSTLLGTTSVSGSGVSATISFTALAVSDCVLHFGETMLGDEEIPPQPIDHAVVDGSVHVQNFILTVSTVGNGSVTLNNSGPYYHYGDVVQLTAVPNSGLSFDHWSGDLAGSANPSGLIITGNMAVTATFVQFNYTLSLSIVGSGGLTTHSGPCYHYGDIVQITAIPAAGWSFQYWSGDLSGSANPATLVMTGNLSVTANFIGIPRLQMSPTGKTCRIYNESFTVSTRIYFAVNVTGLKFEIHYNTTLLDYVGVTWDAWGSGTIICDEAGGNITGFTSGDPLKGTQTLVTIKFEASLHHIWENAANWTNDLTDTIFLQRANISCSTFQNLSYERGKPSQLDVGPDFAYTFSPIQGDVNSDGTVDVFDLRLVAAYYNATHGDPTWTEASTYDLNGDGTIGVSDLEIIIANFKHTYRP